MPNINVLNEIQIKQDNNTTTSYKVGTVNGYYNPTNGKFYKEYPYVNEIEGASNLVYVDLGGNKLYVYKNSSFINVSGSGGGSADNIVFGYYKEADGKFYEDSSYTTEIVPNLKNLYINLTDETIFRYDATNSEYVEISEAIDYSSEINSLSTENSTQTSEINSLSQSASEIASTASTHTSQISSLASVNSTQTSEINSLSTASSELASEYTVINSEVTQIDINKQNSTDNNLATTAKTIVGAINEVNTGLGNINFAGVNFNSGDSTGGVDCNNTTENGVYYYNVNGPSTSIGASTNDGALIVQNYNASWVSQIAIDYRNGSIFSRGKNNGTWTSWVKMQNSTDNTLNTTSKNVVGAINELNTNFSNALTNLKNTQVAEWSRAKNESTFTNFINKLALYQNTNWHDTIGGLTSGGNWGFKLVQNYGCTVENGGFTTGNDASNGIVVENTYGARCLIYFTVTKATSTGSVTQCGAGTSSLTLPTAYTTGANRTQYRDGLSFIVSVPAGYRAYINGANIRITGASWFPIEQDQTSTYSVTSNGTKDMGATNSYRYVGVSVPDPTLSISSSNFTIMPYQSSVYAYSVYPNTLIYLNNVDSAVKFTAAPRNVTYIDGSTPASGQTVPNVLKATNGNINITAQSMNGQRTITIYYSQK